MTHDQEATTILRSWRTRFATIDDCPWPGPRPLRPTDAGSLIGRVDDRRMFQRVIRDSRLVLLHGPSGVGKSSLISAGLIPDLERSGFTAYKADQWGDTDTDDLRTFLADRLGLPDAGGDRFAAVDSASVALVLDQFEELIRYSPHRAQAVFDLIIDLNRTSKTRVVVSFRSEYLHEFADLERRVMNFTTSHFRLDPVKDDVAENVVLSAIRARPDLTPLDQAEPRETARLIAETWRAAGSRVIEAGGASDPVNRVGLLHLQAFLYALWFASGTKPIGRVAVDQAIETWRPDGFDETTDHPDVAVFHEALQRSVDSKLAHCRAAAEDISRAGAIDSFLLDGAYWAVGRTVKHLSSAGYKLIRQARELSALALDSDLEAIGDGLSLTVQPTGEQHAALFDAMLATSHLGGIEAGEGSGGPDLLSAGRTELAELADERLAGRATWSSRLEPGVFDIDRDAIGVTAGPMFRLDPADVLIEEYRRFLFGLVWLETSSLIRVTTLPGAGAMVSLIHDGFGSALTRWADRHLGDPAGPLSAITAPRGASFGWRQAPATVDSAERPPDVAPREGEAWRVIPNLVWRGAWLRADLERVVFVNCDLRGLLLDGCRLTGVNFVNCLLDGAIFSDCVIRGPHDLREHGVWSDDEPTFVVEAPADLVAAHARYRGIEPGEAKLLSPLPGAPAYPFRGEAGADRLRRPRADGTEVDPEITVGRLDVLLTSGGVTVHGGRVSNLVVRGCVVEDGSALYLRHSAGSGIDLVELDSAPLRLSSYGCALRQISMTPRVGERGAIDVDIVGSVFSQVWIGPGTQGAVRAKNSVVVHAWNAAPGPGGVSFTLDPSCSHHGLIDVDPRGSTVLGPGEQAVPFEQLARPVVRDQHQRMDYRRNPAQTRSRGGS